MNNGMDFDNDFDNDGEFESDSNLWQAAENRARKAFELYEDGKISQALSAIDQAIQIDPENAHWHFNKALALDAMECFEEAINSYNAALEANPNDVEILNCLAVDYTRIGQYDLSTSVFEQIEKIAPDFEPAYCNRIISYTEMGDYEKAEQMFYLAQQINDQCPLCFYNIGNLFFIQGNYKQAIWCWKKTASIESDHPQINYRIAQGYWAMGKDTMAYNYFLNELRKNPGDIDVIFDFGLFLLKIDNIKSATEKFHRILELQPDFAPAIHYLGEIQLHKGNYENAERVFQKALKFDSDMSGPRFRLAQCAIASGENDKAFLYLTDELAQEQSDDDVIMAIGNMLKRIGKIEHAMHCFLRITETQPKNADNYLNLAEMLAAKSEYADSVDFLEYAMTLKEDDADFIRSIARIYSSMNMPARSVQAIIAAEKIEPKKGFENLLLKTKYNSQKISLQSMAVVKRIKKHFTKQL